MSTSSTSSTGPAQGSPPTSIAGSPRPSVVKTAAVITHAVPALVEDALGRVRALAARLGVQLVDDAAKPDIAIVLGGDGSMLRALTRYLGTGVPVLGVNFGRVGFLTAVAPDSLERDLERVFAGDYRVVELPTLDVTLGGETHPPVTDAVHPSLTTGPT